MPDDLHDRLKKAKALEAKARAALDALPNVKVPKGKPRQAKRRLIQSLKDKLAALVRRIRRLRQRLRLGSDDKLRQRIIAYCEWGVANATPIHYSNTRPYPSNPRALPMYTDCSGFATLAYKDAGGPDPNGASFNGYGFCHEPSARILTRDLRWVPAGDLQPGDELWAFDENIGEEEGGGRERTRRYREAFVVASFPSKKECVCVCLDTGETLICSTDHPWLSYPDGTPNHRWTQARHLLERPNLIRPFLPWETASSWEAGWLAGMFDGEGWTGNRAARGKRTNHIGITQALGATADRLQELAPKYGSFATATIERDYGKPRINMTTNGGGAAAAAAFIGTIRAERLIANFNIEGGLVQKREAARVVAVEPVGVREVQSIETTARTYFAEGFAVHNTGTILQHCRHIAKTAAKPGDLVVFGAYPGTHVVVLLEAGSHPDPLTVSHGQEAGPTKYPVSVEADAHAGQTVTYCSAL